MPSNTNILVPNEKNFLASFPLPSLHGVSLTKFFLRCVLQTIFLSDEKSTKIVIFTNSNFDATHCKVVIINF